MPARSLAPWSLPSCLLTVDNKHVLEVAVMLIFTLGVAIHGVNYALYCAAIAAGVLIAIDLPHPANFTREALRVLYTFVGVGLAVLVMLLATELGKRAAPNRRRTQREIGKADLRVS